MKLGLIVVITVSLFVGGMKLGNIHNQNMSVSKTVYASNMNSYSVSDVIKTKEIKVAEKQVNKGKILLYSSHSCEKNAGGNILKIGADLKTKLERKGFQVEFRDDDFANQQGYNKSYSSSAKMLDSKNLSEYVLVIDIHINSGANPIITKDKNNHDIAQIEMVQTKTNPNLEAENKIADGITKEINKFCNISKGVLAVYNRGINFYNLSKSPNMILLEMGNNFNDEISTKMSNTYLSSAINTYFESLLK